jgi:hypothetical protein
LGHITEATTSLNAPKVAAHLEKNDIFMGYLSDLSEDLPQLENEVNVIVIDSDDEDPAPTSDQILSGILPIFHIQKPPPLKRCHLDVPSWVTHQKAQEEHCTILQCGLLDIKKVIALTKTKFVSGHEGLQAYRARAIQSYLFMIVKNGWRGIDASEQAAEAQGIAPKWGGRLVRQWVQRWLSVQALHKSSRGQHTKSYSLLDDPAIWAELRLYLRSNKWAMNPAKLAEFSQKTMIPTAANKYLRHIVKEEMPHGVEMLPGA